MIDMQRCDYSPAEDCSECLKTFCPYCEPDFEPERAEGWTLDSYDDYKYWRDNCDGEDGDL